tara:strand:+ start:1003 stop:1398 length:396 start_codon:yes stop_codon:yes gene_type:complete
MDSIPSSVSFAQLAGFLAQSKEEPEEPSTELYGDFSREELEAIAEDAINSVIEIAPDPMVHKIMALKILAKFVNWHNSYGNRILEMDGLESDAAVDWFNDAGMLKAAGMLLAQVSIGSNDYTAPDEEGVDV